MQSVAQLHLQLASTLSEGTLLAVSIRMLRGTKTLGIATALLSL